MVSKILAVQCSIPVSAGCEGMGALLWQVCV